MNKFDALRIVNKRAKYHNLQNEDVNSIRSRALYKLKYRCINEWKNDFKTVEKHRIHNDILFCFYSKNWSYHIPEDKLIKEGKEYSRLDIINISEFETVNYNNLDQTEKDALQYIFENHGLNANNFIPNNVKHNNKWYYLPNEGFKYSHTQNINKTDEW